MAANTPSTTGNESNSNSSGNISIVQNNLQSRQEIKITITNDTTAAQNNLLIVPGPCPNMIIAKFSCVIPDQVHCVLSSSVTSSQYSAALQYSETNNYLAAVGMHVVYIRMQTTDTNIYTGSLFLGELPGNGIASPQEIVLSDYATVIGGGGSYDKTLKIADMPFVNSRNFFMYISQITVSSTTSFSFGYNAIGDTVTVASN